MIVFITGSESTGKTSLARKLSGIYEVNWVPEFAREYVSSLKVPYTFEDVEFIARKQVQQIREARNVPLIFFDTGLIITKIWFEMKFEMVPEWFMEIYQECAKGMYLLCCPDIKWEPDPLRENPDIRIELNNAYEDEIKKISADFSRISGNGQQRTLMAVRAVDRWLGER